MEKELPNGIRIETAYHQKIENHPLYKKLNEMFFNTVEEHTCAADDSQNYGEEEGFYVSGTHEAAYFIATWVFKNMKEAWEDGWRVRHLSCGKSKAEILHKKKLDYDAFKSSLINEITALNPSNNEAG